MIECAKYYMQRLSDIFRTACATEYADLKEQLLKTFELFRGEQKKLRFVYQVISGLHYYKASRELEPIYAEYMEYSDLFAERYEPIVKGSNRSF